MAFQHDPKCISRRTSTFKGNTCSLNLVLVVFNLRDPSQISTKHFYFRYGLLSFVTYWLHFWWLLGELPSLKLPVRTWNKPSQNTLSSSKHQFSGIMIVSGMVCRISFERTPWVISEYVCGGWMFLPKKGLTSSVDMVFFVRGLLPYNP